MGCFSQTQTNKRHALKFCVCPAHELKTPNPLSFCL
jgi:hypothetical protein